MKEEERKPLEELEVIRLLMDEGIEGVLKAWTEANRYRKEEKI